MSFFDRFKRKPKKTFAEYRAERENYAGQVLDPGATALLYTTVVSDRVDDDTTPALADDTAKDDTCVDANE